MDPAAAAAGVADLHEHSQLVSRCDACPRLVAWRELVARDKRAAYADEAYWGRPVPGFGDPAARILVVGLAPAAHGANRTGRIFTGDRSGDWLYRALHRAGLSSRPVSVSRNDGLRLTDTWITAAARCAPPDNRPTPAELATCRPWLVRELELLRPTLRVVVCLGQIAYHSLWHALAALPDVGQQSLPRPRPRFGHGVEVQLVAPAITIVCSYHPSQQNTFTGRLTEPMFDAVFAAAVQRAG